MKSLHEKIAALFRKGSPVSANAELTPSLYRRVAEDPAFQIVVGSTLPKKELKTLTTAPRRLLRAL